MVNFRHREPFGCWCDFAAGSVEHGRVGFLECDRGYTSWKAMLKFSALSEAGVSWRLHGDA
ncbi:hypothetical protein FA849_10425 [Escherichia coli]|nr:hypothetical protein [Escherichia coli]